MAEGEEVVIALPGTVQPVRSARSTVLQGSVSAIRACGRFDEYAKYLPAQHRDAILQTVAGTWIPSDVAFAHYEACDRAGLGPDVAFINGRHTFDVAGSVVFGTVLKMAKAAGVTPWTLLEQFTRFWERSYEGGAVGVTRVGPKEARVTLVKSRLFESPYYRSALRGVVTAAVDLFCTKSYVNEKSGPRPPHSFVMRVQWA